MPITPTSAKLWFKTQKEIDEYDDKMISNIELKSLEYDDENFSPVFDRSKKEVFFKPSEKFNKDIQKFFAPYTTRTLEEFVDKFLLNPPNHTYYRTWTLDKFLAGFGVGYILLRELPLRNFYARCLVMWLLSAKLLDHFNTPFPSLTPNAFLIQMKDQWSTDDIKGFDVYNTFRRMEIPTARNQISESKLWYAKQPAHMNRRDEHNFVQFFASPFRKTSEAYWDGTMNMPILRLGDPKHRESYMYRY